MLRMKLRSTLLFNSKKRAFCDLIEVMSSSVKPLPLRDRSKNVGVFGRRKKCVSTVLRLGGMSNATSIGNVNCGAGNLLQLVSIVVRSRKQNRGLVYIESKRSYPYHSVSVSSEILQLDQIVTSFPVTYLSSYRRDKLIIEGDNQKSSIFASKVEPASTQNPALRVTLNFPLRVTSLPPETPPVDLR